ncbi:aromatic hydrocarbon degradation protein [Paracoccus liaowanqingii]|uniref:Aromatic hydrocarbon degradation protein n=1 Tax=Paracoccus liaowanqingii TaxID=2560053 RepID=A0A4P7HJ17_9RHOB|nr:outer membrane protein transport protein [Paracoccus liaowanqingii]QBX34118.1 aromatic hydrocarbon degradation protein [Paracoccus liaowanqingii]
MKFALTGMAALLAGTAPVWAGGIERAPQSLAALFEEGNYVELSFGGVDPTVEGTDVLGFRTGDVAQGYGFAGLSYKHQFTPSFSGAIIVEQPFGADILYPSQPGLLPDPSAEGSVLLGGTAARVDSTTFTALGRYQFQNAFSVHGGLRGSRADGEVTLDGAAYGPVAGYNVDLDANTAFGWVAGVAWERPEIGARVSLTYNSDVEHEFDTVETGPLVDPDGPGPIPAVPLLNASSTTTVTTPESWNLEFQTGVAADTLVFGSVRWVEWSAFRVDPQQFVAVTGGGLVELEDTTTYTLGVGRKFTESWSGSASFTFEKAGDDLVSPLAPTNGRKGITLAAIYNQGPLRVTTGINYTKLGDASPETGTPDVERARMEDGDALGIGVRIGYRF